MTGGLMQLVAYGAQDIYLTGNPMITYFKVVYRRHTNFAVESIAQTFNGNIGFNSRCSALISRNGDLVSGLTLEVSLPTIADTNALNFTTWIDKIGHYLIKEVSIEIGGQEIDKHYDDWLEIWAQLSVPAEQRYGYNAMIGHDIIQQDYSETIRRGLQFQSAGNEFVNPGQYLDENNRRVLYIPLQFWFCRNYGLALPLIALQYHEVKINLKTRAANELFNAGDATGAGITTLPTGLNQIDFKLWADYIYLDTDERRRFAQVSHEYLIEQLQFNGITPFENVNTSISLNFNHPVKELVWICQQSRNIQQSTTVVNPRVNQWSNFTTNLSIDTRTQGTSDANPVTTPDIETGGNPAKNICETAVLKLNGHERFSKQQGPYFNMVQPYEHHTNIPESPGINVYSFALKPEDHQPSGTCNFSRIDNAELILTLRGEQNGVFNADDQGIIKVFATNYNVLRIMSGMGGLAYSN